MSPMRMTQPAQPRPIKSDFVFMVALHGVRGEWNGFKGEDEGERVTSALPV